MNATVKTIVVWIGFIALAAVLYRFVSYPSEGSETKIAYSDFLDRVQRGAVLEVTIVDFNIKGTMKSSSGGRAVDRFKTVMADDPKLVETLRANNVKISAEKTETNPWFQALFSSAPFLFVVGFWIFFMRQTQKVRNKTQMNERDDELLARLERVENRLAAIEALISAR